MAEQAGQKRVCICTGSQTADVVKGVCFNHAECLPFGNQRNVIQHRNAVIVADFCHHGIQVRFADQFLWHETTDSIKPIAIFSADKFCIVDWSDKGFF